MILHVEGWNRIAGVASASVTETSVYEDFLYVSVCQCQGKASYEAINETTLNDWKGFCKHVETLEHEYWAKDGIIEDATEDLELEIQSSESNKESDDNSSKIYKIIMRSSEESKVNILLGRVYALASISCVCLALSRCFGRFLCHMVFYDRANRKGSVLPIREAFYSISAMMLEWLGWWGLGPTSFSDDFFSATQSSWKLVFRKMSDQAATLRELPVAEDTAKLPSDAALESNVANEIAFGDVGPSATRTLPFAAGIPDFTAYRPTMTIQREYVSVTFAAARAHVPTEDGPPPISIGIERNPAIPIDRLKGNPSHLLVVDALLLRSNTTGIEEKWNTSKAKKRSKARYPLQHETRFHSVDNVDLMNRGQMTLQARLLSETVAAVVTGKLPFSSAFPLHVPPQVAQHRVSPAAFLTGEPRPRETCRTKRKMLLSVVYIDLVGTKRTGKYRENIDCSDLDGDF
ncbi:hypothetical protein WN48_02090 [Eufriesea mexicana]|nr:hypothetical protein WN48_02090 [Eufriesea mexicana]